MLMDLEKITEHQDLECDICIVGAGAAGITMALEFMHTPYKVLLMESGAFNFNAKTQSLYDGEVTGRPVTFTPTTSRLRYFGGTTNHWGGWAAPLDKIDFEERKGIPLSGWPINLDDLQPYYDRAQLHLANHSFDFYDFDKWTSKKLIPLPFDKNKIVQKIYEDMPTRFGPKYHETLTRAGNITVCIHANLTDIQTNEERSSVKSLTFRSLKNTSIAVKAQSYILACGGIENARRLLLTGIGEKTALGNRYGLVGKYFMNHPHVPAGEVYMTKHDYNHLRLYYPWNQTKYDYTYLATFRLPDELVRKKEILNVHIMIRTLSDYMYQTDSITAYWALDDLIKRSHLSMSEREQNDLQVIVKDFDQLLPDINRKLLHDPSVNSAYYYTLYVRSEQQPNPDSKITLNSHKDLLGQNEIDLDWQFTALDKISIRESMLALASEFGSTGIGRVRLFDWLEKDDNYWSKNTGEVCHHSGTTKMNVNPRLGVVDKNCKVHDVANLYMAGSSVFPTVGASNPTFTIVAMSVRLSDFLKKKIHSDK